MNLAIFLLVVIGIGAVFGALSKDTGVGIFAGVVAFLVVGGAWAVADEGKARTARTRACADACLAVDAPMARSDGGCWCYRGASEMFRVEVQK